MLAFRRGPVAILGFVGTAAQVTALNAKGEAVDTEMRNQDSLAGEAELMWVSTFCTLVMAETGG